MTDAQNITRFDFEGFANRLKEAIFPEKLGAFANRSGVSQAVISKYTNPSRAFDPSLPIVAKISEALGCSIDWLVTGAGDGPDGNAGIVKLPRWDVTLAAGAGDWNEGRRKVEDMPFTAEFLRTQIGRPNADGLSVLQARGDSMFPTIRDRAFVVVDERDTRPDDDVFAFLMHGDARIKRFRRLVDGLEISSDNAAYEPEQLTEEQLRSLQVIGRAKIVLQTIR